MRRFLVTSAFALAMASGLCGQIDPEKARIKHLMEQVDSEMKEIDRLLLQTSSRNGGTAAERDLKKVQELIAKAKTTQGSAGENIKKLIEEIDKLANQNKSKNQQSDDPSQQEDSQSGSSQQQRQQRQQREQQQSDQQRQQQQQGVQTPDMVPQDKQQGEQQGKPQEQGKKPEPKDGQDPKSAQADPKTQGRNQTGPPKPDGGEERTDKVIDNQRWGMLPKYLEFMHARGSLPEVPERYRRLYEAYLKSGQKPPADAARK